MRKVFGACLSATALTLALTLPGLRPAFADPAPAAPVAPASLPAPAALPSDKVLVPEGTQIHFSLLKDLKSGGNKAGEDVPFEVSKDVYGPGRVLLIAASTPAYGKIQKSLPARHLRQGRQAQVHH